VKIFQTTLVWLREFSWLGADRALAWVRVLAVCNVVVIAGIAVITHGGDRPDPWGHPFATDFVSFWTAARLAIDGSPEAAWIPALHAAAQARNFSAGAGYAPGYFAFFYPPPFLLLCLPLGYLTYGWAATAWLAMTVTAYVATLRRLLPARWPTILIALAYPAALINAGHGQNGFLTTALLATAALQLDKRPGIAGACLGALCFKPQLALMIVPSLLLARRWRSLAWAVATAVLFCVASLLAFGPAAWQRFADNTDLARQTLENGLVSYAKMASTFAAIRLLGGSVDIAFAAQAAVSVTVLVILLAIVRHRPGAAVEGAAMALGGCMLTPFLLDYDLMLLIVPLAWIATQADRSASLPWEKLVGVMAFMLPLLTRLVAEHVGLPVAPVLMFALLACFVRRARRHLPTLA